MYGPDAAGKNHRCCGQGPADASFGARLAFDRDGLLSKSREKRVAYPRQLAMYLMRELAQRSLVEIGISLGGRDHSTVHHGWRKMERSLVVDPETKRDVASLRELIERSRQVA